jgi:hypothetical protein
MRLTTSLRLAWHAQRYFWFRYWLAAATIATAVAAIHVNLALTVRPLDRTAALVDSLQTRYLILFDSFATTLDASILDDRAAALKQAGVVAHHDFLCGYFFSDPDPIPLLFCSLPSSRPLELAGLYRVIKGREPAPDADEAMLEETLAARWDLTTGDSIVLIRNRPPLKVVGIYARSPELASGDVFAPLHTVQRLKNRPGELSFVLLELRSDLPVEAGAARVAGIFPDQRVLPAAAAAERLRAGSQPLRIAELAQASLIAFLCGLIGLFTLFSAVNERMRDFQVMRALGISRTAILGQVMIEGLVLGGKGAVSGILIGEAILVSLAPRLHPVLGGHSQWQEFLLPFGIGLSVAVLGALLPAAKACRARPHELLQA